MANIAIPTTERHNRARLAFSGVLLGWLRDILDGLMSPGLPDDPVARFSSVEWADLPTHHPTRDE